MPEESSTSLPVISVLDFVNQVRALLGSPALPALALLGTEVDDEERGVVGSALGVPIGGSEHPGWSCRGCWVMRFANSRIAERAATRLGQ